MDDVQCAYLFSFVAFVIQRLINEAFEFGMLIFQLDENLFAFLSPLYLD